MSARHTASANQRTSVSHVTSCDIPRLQVDMTRAYLASRERRKGTARCRREWLDSRRDDDDDRSLTLRQRLPEYRKFVNRHSRHQQKRELRPSSQSTTSSCWEDEVRKRNVPERVSFVRTIVLGSPTPPRKQRTDTPRHITAMFQTTNTPRDKHRDRIHFIDKDWNSERVSWLRFQQPGVADIHRFSWIQ